MEMDIREKIREEKLQGGEISSHCWKRSVLLSLARYYELERNPEYENSSNRTKC